MKKLMFLLLVYSTHKKTAQRGWFRWECLQYTSTSCFINVWASSFSPLLGRTRSRSRCWAINWLSYHPKPSCCALWRGRWIGHLKTTWSTVWSSPPHSHVTEGAIPHLCKQERKTSDTNAEAVEPDPCCFWLSHSRRVGQGWNYGVSQCSPTFRIPSVIRPERCISATVIKWTNELLCSRYKWVSQFEIPRITIQRTGDGWEEQMSRFNGMACWRQCGSFATKLSRLDACKDRNIVRWCRTHTCKCHKIAKIVKIPKIAEIAKLTKIAKIAKNTKIAVITKIIKNAKIRNLAHYPGSKIIQFLDWICTVKCSK